MAAERKEEREEELDEIWEDEKHVKLYIKKSHNGSMRQGVGFKVDNVDALFGGRTLVQYHGECRETLGDVHRSVRMLKDVSLYPMAGRHGKPPTDHEDIPTYAPKHVIKQE